MWEIKEVIKIILNDSLKPSQGNQQLIQLYK